MSEHDYWASTSTYDFMLDKADGYFDEGKFNDALIIYKNLSANGVDDEMYFKIASCYYNLKNFEKAIIYFEKSLQLNKRRWSAFNYLADSYEQIGEISKAIHNYSWARTLKPDEVFSVLKLGILYASNKMEFESFYFYNKFLLMSKDKREDNYRTISRTMNDARMNSDRLYHRGQRAYSSKDLYSARNDFLSAYKMFPINYDLNISLAKVFHDLGDYQKSINYYLNALFLRPENNKLFMQIASEYSYLRDYTKAYCFIKRYQEGLITTHNQEEYLKVMKNLKALESHVNKAQVVSVDLFIENNKYREALYEYENYSILNSTNLSVEERIILQDLESLVYPEKTLSKLYNKAGLDLYNAGRFKDANKFFSRVMEISERNTEEYKLAKVKFSNV